MDQGHYENPMAEIALALAMGFFAIMVLTMVSMGAGSPADADAVDPVDRIVAAALRPAVERSAAAATIDTPERDALVIYHDGRFLDARLEELDPRSLRDTQLDTPIVLAIAPTLSLARAMEARSSIDREDVVVATLDARWLEALEGTDR